MKTFALTFMAIVALTGCAQRTRHLPKQGITGYIRQVRGNQMPRPGRPRGNGRGVNREVYIYMPTLVQQTAGAMPLFNSVNTKLVATTQSDSTGKYTIALPTGNYSVFIKEAGGFFAAETDENGTLCPVKVRSNTLTVKDVFINNQAAY